MTPQRGTYTISLAPKHFKARRQVCVTIMSHNLVVDIFNNKQNRAVLQSRLQNYANLQLTSVSE